MVNETVNQSIPADAAFRTRQSVPGLLRWLGRVWLAITGWKIEGSRPQVAKYVAIFAPHTSNWDFPFMISIVFVLGVRAHWFGKRELFRWPTGSLLRWMGGIPIDRRARKNMVGQAAEALRSNQQMMVGVAPEGTRSHAEYWKSGFYHIAQQADVPIVPAYLDYARKLGGFGPPITVSGDIEADMALIRQFYRGVTARFPYKVGPMAVRPQVASES